MAVIGRLRSPLETGGVLLKGELLELPNQAPMDERTDRYLIYLGHLETVIGDASVDDVLFWHTHPGGMVGPSKMDMEGRLERFQYMVVALTENDAIPVRY